MRPCTRGCIRIFEIARNVGGRAMRAPTTLRKIATVRCVCNAGSHHCNGQMYLQPSVAPPYTVGARIARPFISDVITTFRAGARRVIGATAKPLYPIDGKAGGLDRRIPKTSLFEGGGPPQRWKEFVPRSGGRSKQTVEGVHPFTFPGCLRLSTPPPLFWWFRSFSAYMRWSARMRISAAAALSSG